MSPGRPKAARRGGLAKAIAAAKTVTRLAELLGVSVQAVSQWDEVPAERCLDVERETGVSRHELRPDIYGRAPKKQGDRPTKRAPARAAA